MTRGFGDLVEEAARAARNAEVRAEKALRLAEISELRARAGGTKGALYLAEARRLRAEAGQYADEARRHEEAVGVLREMTQRGWT